MVCEIITVPTPRGRFSRERASTRSTMPRPPRSARHSSSMIDEVVPARLEAGVGERVRDRDRAEPGDQHAISAARWRSTSAVVDRGHVEHGRAVAPHRRRVCVGEQLADAAAAEHRRQGLDERVDRRRGNARGRRGRGRARAARRARRSRTRIRSARTGTPAWRSSSTAIARSSSISSSIGGGCARRIVMSAATIVRRRPRASAITCARPGR